MFDDLRNLVRADLDKNILLVRKDGYKGYQPSNIRAAEAEVVTLKETAQDLLDFIEELENPEPEE